MTVHRLADRRIRDLGMTMTDRAAAYVRAYPKWRASWPLVVKEQGADCLYATWLIGNNYQAKSPLYGSYPPGYLDRISVLFPDLAEGEVLHAFSGSLPPGPYVRLDLMSDADRQPDIVGSVIDAGKIFGWPRFDLVFADPPYSAPDAAFYGTPMISRRKAMSALAEVTRPGGFLVWLDCVWPMFAKSEWRTAGRITIVRSTNHRIRMATIFERRAA